MKYIYSLVNLRVGAYVDGLNVYHGGRHLCGRDAPGWRWFDLAASVERMIARNAASTPRWRQTRGHGSAFRPLAPRSHGDHRSTSDPRHRGDVELSQVSTLRYSNDSEGHD